MRYTSSTSETRLEMMTSVIDRLLVKAVKPFDVPNAEAEQANRQRNKEEIDHQNFTTAASVKVVRFDFGPLLLLKKPWLAMSWRSSRIPVT